VTEYVINYEDTLFLMVSIMEFPAKPLGVESALILRRRGTPGNVAARRRLELIVRTLSHYHIAAAIGAGGMGEVYCATDTKLGRDVALKVLPTEMARDPRRLVRFQREARAVAALNHPHLVTIFSVEEADGVHFLTMELIEGQPLDRLIPEGGFPVERIVDIATALRWTPHSRST
jgi:serine/threonine protein kinase